MQPPFYPISAEKSYMTVETENPFGAPVYYIENTASTMDDARILAAAGAPDGTVIAAGNQSGGRGRLEGRIWNSAAGANLLCTIILRRPYEPGFTLRAGLAAARAVIAHVPPAIPVRIKWPNDILAAGKKITGILCESDGDCLYTGIGCNIAQKNFPPEIARKATSIALLAPDVPDVSHFLTGFLRIFRGILSAGDWKTHVEALLYRNGETVTFYPGTTSAQESAVTGIICGISPAGELLIQTGNTVIPYNSGELIVQ